MNLLHLFDLSLCGRSDRAALEFSDATFTFGEIDARSNRLAAALAERGLRAGDRLCVQLPNSVEMIDLFLACVKSGIVFVPINVLYRQREIEHIVHDAEPAAIVAGDDFPSERWSIGELMSAAEGTRSDRPQVVLDGSAPAAIVYTSGTTGASKGAVLSHDNFSANAINVTTCWQITDRDRFLLALPLFHVHALGNGVHAWLVSGCRMRLLERFDHRKAEELLRFRPTLFFGVPTMYVRLGELPGEVAREIGSGMRLFVCGSAPLPAQLLEEFRAKFGHVILERYGMSETLMNISNPYVGERRAGTVGLPLPGVQTRIVNDGGDVATGDTGELWLRGPNVFSGYWRNERATDEAFVDGWFRTGDVASRSDDGYFTLHGRRSDLIISGGFNIYPREIEELLLEQRGVVEAAVVGVRDPVRGEVPVAFVVCSEEVTDAELERACRENLASFKLPRRFHRVASLPRNALGKVQKHLLRE